MARVRASGVVLSSPGVAQAAAPAPPPRTRGGGLAGGLAGGLSQLGPRGYLYLLVLIEVGVIAFLRHTFRDHHGG